MHRRLRTLLVSMVLAFALGLLLVASARRDLTLEAPHVVRASKATLAPALRAAVEYALGDAERPRTVEDALHFALRVTGARLHFGLGHETRLSFGPDERAAHSVEYAHLFARVFDMAAKRAGLSAHAYVVHSEARMFGWKIPVLGLGDHDWALVVDETTGVEKKRWYVDPAFEDVHLGWDVAANVRGEPKVPR